MGPLLAIFYFLLMFTLLPLFLLSLMRAACAVDANTYVVEQFRNKELKKAYLAHLTIQEGKFNLVSEGEATLVLMPRKPKHSLSDGTYKLIQREGPIPLLREVRLKKTRGIIEVYSRSNKILSLKAIKLPSLMSVSRWSLPLGSDRQSLKQLKTRLVQKFGIHQLGYKRSRKTVGIRLVSQAKEPLYPIGPGRVISMSYWRLGGSIVVEHLHRGSYLYSYYRYLKEPHCRVGDRVDPQSILGQTLSASESRRLGREHPYLTLEIRHHLRDRGRFSRWGATSKRLAQCCLDPVKFFEANLLQFNHPHTEGAWATAPRHFQPPN